MAEVGSPLRNPDLQFFALVIHQHPAAAAARGSDGAFSQLFPIQLHRVPANNCTTLGNSPYSFILMRSAPCSADQRNTSSTWSFTATWVCWEENLLQFPLRVKQFAAVSSGEPCSSVPRGEEERGESQDIALEECRSKYISHRKSITQADECPSLLCCCQFPELNPRHMVQLIKTQICMTRAQSTQQGVSLDCKAGLAMGELPLYSLHHQESHQRTLNPPWHMMGHEQG